MCVIPTKLFQIQKQAKQIRDHRVKLSNTQLGVREGRGGRFLLKSNILSCIAPWRSGKTTFCYSCKARACPKPRPCSESSTGSVTLHTDPHTALLKALPGGTRWSLASSAHLILRMDLLWGITDHHFLSLLNTSSQGNSPEDSETNKQENTGGACDPRSSKWTETTKIWPRSTSVRKEKEIKIMRREGSRRRVMLSTLSSSDAHFSVP